MQGECRLGAGRQGPSGWGLSRDGLQQRHGLHGQEQGCLKSLLPTHVDFEGNVAIQQESN